MQIHYIIINVKERLSYIASFVYIMDKWNLLNDFENGTNNYCFQGGITVVIVVYRIEWNHYFICQIWLNLIVISFLTGSTMIYHDLPNGSYSFSPNVAPNIHYNISMVQIVALINVSHKCRQFLRMETLNTLMVYSYGKKWKQRSGAYMNNWGTPTGVYGCQCNLKKGKTNQNM